MNKFKELNINGSDNLELNYDKKMVSQAYCKEKTVKNCFENVFVFFINNFPWL